MGLSGLVQCPYCGEYFKSVVHHLWPAHGVRAGDVPRELREQLISGESRQAYAKAWKKQLKADPDRLARIREGAATIPTEVRSEITRRLYAEGRIRPTRTYGGKPKRDRSKCSRCGGPMPPERASTYANLKTCSDECARLAGAEAYRRQAAQREVCANGHPYTAENTIVQKNRHGFPYKRCRICRNKAKLRHYRKTRN